MCEISGALAREWCNSHMIDHTYKDKLIQIRSSVHNMRRDGMGQKQKPECACARMGHMTGGTQWGALRF